MIKNITKILDKLKIEKDGVYKNNFYEITLDSSDEYAKIYTKLDETAVNEEYPAIEKNTNESLTKIISYFNVDVENITYKLILIADFNEDSYKLKIGE